VVEKKKKEETEWLAGRETDAWRSGGREKDQEKEKE